MPDPFDPPTTETRPAPDPAKSLLNQFARELAGMPEPWQRYRFEVIAGQTKYELVRLTGAIAPSNLSGAQKGRPNWAKLDPATERVVHFTRAELAAWHAAWEARTGLCAACQGEGRKVHAWHRETGTEYRPCRECGGSGRKANAKTA